MDINKTLQVWGWKVAIIEGSTPLPYSYWSFCPAGVDYGVLVPDQWTVSEETNMNSACEVVDRAGTWLQIKSWWCHEYD